MKKIIARTTGYVFWFVLISSISWCLGMALGAVGNIEAIITGYALLVVCVMAGSIFIFCAQWVGDNWN